MIKLAKKTLIENNYALVVVQHNKIVYMSEEKGIKPLMSLMEENLHLLKDSALADQVTGKAAALLSTYGEVSEIYSHLLSESAKNVLEEANIPVTYGRLTKIIKNQDKTDLCPMEKIASQTDDPLELIELIKRYVSEKERIR